MRSKPNYEEHVVTWRINVGKGNGDFVKVKQDADSIDVIEDEEEPVHNSRNKTGRVNYEKKSAMLVSNALRNRENMKKALKALPMPWSFARLIITSALAATISVATMVVLDVIFNSLFATLQENVDMIHIQMNVFRCAYSALGAVLQLVSVNQYGIFGNTYRGLVRLENAYPYTYTTKAELFNWSTSRLMDLMTEMKQEIAKVENTPYHSLSDINYDTNIAYIVNGSNLVYNNISVLVGCKLVVRGEITPE